MEQILLHPVDRGELTRHAVALLGHGSLRAEDLVALSGEAAPGPKADPALSTAWERFRDGIFGWVATLEQATIAALEGRLDPELRRKAEREAHKVSTSVGNFGFPEGSRLAREIEQVFAGTTPILPARAVRLSEQISSLRKELGRTPGLAGEGGKPLLLVVGTDARFSGRLSTEAATRGARVAVVADHAAARGAIEQERPAVLVLDLASPAQAEEAYPFLAEVSTRIPRVPVLVVAKRSALVDRVRVSRLCGGAVIQRPASAARVMEAALQAARQFRAAEFRVLAVDDDADTLELLRTLLEPHQIRVAGLSNPLRFWDVLERSNPDLLVLDVDMPHLSGIELCRVIRSDTRWRSLPVVFLTSQAEPETIFRVFAAGADDFVSKPIVGPELVARISSRLQRVHAHSDLTETDGLTGLAPRHRAREALIQMIRLASRHREPLCLALLDVDGLHQINRRHGHEAGDEVLRHVGEVLLSNLRGEDVIARWSGDEFLVGMYGTSGDDGRRKIESLVETLRGHTFFGPRTRFTATLSAGLAEFPADGEDLPSLCQVADLALNQAKSAGRTRAA
ncbi:MAG: diguanylate cyclase, partial [Gemmatimonadota bacterium]|nr:diguanylate cyclase [Gemmatimonadota bacterium]